MVRRYDDVETVGAPTGSHPPRGGPERGRSRGPEGWLIALLAGCTTGDPAAEAVQEGRFDPGTLVGEEVTVTGEVTRSPDGPVFRLSGDEFGGDGLAVVFPGAAALEEGALAQVTGVVTEG